MQPAKRSTAAGCLAHQPGRSLLVLARCPAGRGGAAGGTPAGCSLLLLAAVRPSARCVRARRQGARGHWPARQCRPHDARRAQPAPWPHAPSTCCVSRPRFAGSLSRRYCRPAPPAAVRTSPPSNGRQHLHSCHQDPAATRREAYCCILRSAAATARAGMCAQRPPSYHSPQTQCRQIVRPGPHASRASCWPRGWMPTIPMCPAARTMAARGRGRDGVAPAGMNEVDR